MNGRPPSSQGDEFEIMLPRNPAESIGREELIPLAFDSDNESCCIQCRRSSVIAMSETGSTGDMVDEETVPHNPETSGSEASKNDENVIGSRDGSVCELDFVGQSRRSEINSSPQTVQLMDPDTMRQTCDVPEKLLEDVATSQKNHVDLVDTPSRPLRKKARSSPLKSNDKHSEFVVSSRKPHGQGRRRSESEGVNSGDINNEVTTEDSVRVTRGMWQRVSSISAGKATRRQREAIVKPKISVARKSSCVPNRERLSSKSTSASSTSTSSPVPNQSPTSSRSVKSFCQICTDVQRLKKLLSHLSSVLASNGLASRLTPLPLTLTKSSDGEGEGGLNIRDTLEEMGHRTTIRDSVYQNDCWHPYSPTDVSGDIEPWNPWATFDEMLMSLCDESCEGATVWLLDATSNEWLCGTLIEVMQEHEIRLHAQCQNQSLQSSETPLINNEENMLLPLSLSITAARCFLHLFHRIGATSQALPVSDEGDSSSKNSVNRRVLQESTCPLGVNHSSFVPGRGDHPDPPALWLSESDTFIMPKESWDLITEKCSFEPHWSTEDDNITEHRVVSGNRCACERLKQDTEATRVFYLSLSNFLNWASRVFNAPKLEMQNDGAKRSKKK